MCWGCVRLHRHQVHLISYGCVSFSLITIGLIFTIFAIFQKDSQIGKVWLAGPTTMVVGLVLCGKVIIDWGPAMLHGREGSIDSLNQLTMPSNGYLVNDSAQTYLKTPSLFENTPLLNSIIDHSVYGGAPNVSKKISGISFNDQSSGSDVPITNLKNYSNLLMPTTTLNSNIVPFITNNRNKSITSVEESDNCSEKAGKIGAIDCIIYNQSDMIDDLNTNNIVNSVSNIEKMNYNNCNCTNILSSAFSSQQKKQQLASSSRKYSECLCTNNLKYVHSFYLPTNNIKNVINSSTQTYELINENQLNYHCTCNSKHFHYNCQYYKENFLIPRVTTTTAAMPLCLNCNCHYQQQRERQHEQQQQQQQQQQQTYNHKTTKNYDELNSTNDALFDLYNTELCCNSSNNNINIAPYSSKVKCLLQNNFGNIDCNDSSENLNINNSINSQEVYQGETFVMNERSFYI